MAKKQRYIVTASNAYFWQTLAVMADSPAAAAQAFRFYLGDKPQQEAEEYEYASGQAISDIVDEPTDRAQYVYSFEDKDVVEAVGTHTGKTVKMIDSGGNG